MDFSKSLNQKKGHSADCRNLLNNWHLIMPEISIEPPSSHLQFDMYISYLYIKYWPILIYEVLKIAAWFLGYTKHRIFLNITIFTDIKQ